MNKYIVSLPLQVEEKGGYLTLQKIERTLEGREILTKGTISTFWPLSQCPGRVQTKKSVESVGLMVYCPSNHTDVSHQHNHPYTEFCNTVLQSGNCNHQLHFVNYEFLRKRTAVVTPYGSRRSIWDLYCSVEVALCEGSLIPCKEHSMCASFILKN